MVTLFIAIGLSLVALAWIVYAWKRKEQPGAYWFGLFAGSLLLWNLWWIVQTFSYTGFWVNAIAYFSVFVSPALAARLVPVFVGREETVGRRLSSWLYAYIAIIAAIVLTNNWHQGVWRPEIGPSPSSSLVKNEPGPLFFLVAIVDYLIILTAVILYIYHAGWAHSFYRGQAILVLLSALFPVLGSVLYLISFPYGHEITWIAANLALSMIGIGLFHMRLPEVLPLVTPLVLDRLHDGVVIVSTSGQILYINSRGRMLLGIKGGVGQVLEKLSHSPLAADLAGWLQTGEGPSRVHLTTPAGEQVVEIVFYAVHFRARRKRAGVFLLRNVTEQARLEKEREERTRYLEVLANVNQRLLTIQQVEDVIPLFPILCEALHADRVYAFQNVREPGGGGVVTAHIFAQHVRPGMPEFPVKRFTYEFVGLGRWLKALSAGKIIHGPTQTFPAQEREWLLAQGVTSVIIVPVFLGQCLVGFVAADHVVEERVWSEAEMDFLLSLIASFRSALELLRRKEDLERQNRQLNALYAVSASVVSLNPKEVLQRALETVLEELKWDAGWIVMPTSIGSLNELPQVAAARNVPQAVLELSTAYTIRECAACFHLYNHGKTLLSASECLHLDRNVLARVGFQKVIGVPLLGSRATLGILFLAKREHVARSEGVRDLLLLGRHIGTALENAHLHETTRQQAVQDPLTGLYNRRFLAEHLQHLFEASRRTNSPLSVVMIDIDCFKQFNDRYGHPEGDLVLKTVAHLIEANVRGMDIVVRYGGEEFLVVLPGTNQQEAIVVAERVRRAVEKYTFRHYHLFGGAQRITVSIGVATYPNDALTPEELIQASDQALYEAKRAGRNRVAVYQRVILS